MGADGTTTQAVAAATTAALDDALLEDALLDEDRLDEDPFEAFNRAMGADGDANPYPGFAEMTALAEIHRDGGPIDEVPGNDELALYTAYSYAAVHAVLADPAFSSAGYAPVMGEVFGHSILEMDEPEHHTYRSILQQAFTRKEMERWERQLVKPLVDEMIDGFADDGHADLVKQLLFPFPVRVIAALLGLPQADLPEFHRLTIELISVTHNWDGALAASAALREYLSGIVADRRANPADDMISILAAAEHEGTALSDEDIYAFVRMLLPAGAETTYRSSSNLLFGLLTHRDQLDAVLADPSLWPAAIEEGIRWETPLLIIMRTALRDVGIRGVTIPKDAAVICNLGAANHDATRWDRPHEFDVLRRPRKHLGFANGPHTCLGMHLARMEARVVMETLFGRLPGLRLDPDAPAPYISGLTFRAPPRLDVVWDRDEGARTGG